MAKVKKEVEEKDVLPKVLEGDEKVSRRKIIKAGAAAALGAAVTAALPGIASAADGDPLLIGNTNTGTQFTQLTSTQENEVLQLFNDHPDGGGLAVGGSGQRGVSVWGWKEAISGNGDIGVRGASDGDSSQGILGVEGILGRSITPTSPCAGVIGRVKANGDDVTANSNKGVGVMGFSGIGPSKGPNGTGVRGVGSDIGIRAESRKKALDVRGKAHFSNSGHTHIGRGHMYKTFRSRRLNISKNALILVTLQGSAGPSVVVQYAKRVSRYAFKVYLNKKAKKKAKLAFFIIN